MIADRSQSAVKMRISATYARYVVVGADALLQEPIADLPGEDGGALPLVGGDLGDDLGGGDPWLGAAYRPGPDRAGLVISATTNARVTWSAGPRSLFTCPGFSTRIRWTLAISGRCRMVVHLNGRVQRSSVWSNLAMAVR